MGTNRNRCRSRTERGKHRLSLLFPLLPGHQPNLQAKRIKKTLHHQIVLHRQNLGRSHKGRLQAVIDRKRHGKQGNNGFARTHIALQQAVHRAPASEVTIDLTDGIFLRLGQGVGQARMELLGHLPGMGKPCRLPVPPDCTVAQGKKELGIKKLRPLHPVTGPCELLMRRGKMHFTISLTKRHQSVKRKHGRGEILLPARSQRLKSTGNKGAKGL